MPDSNPYDPFADLQDEDAATPVQAREAFLDSTRRGYVPFRRVLVQQPRGSETRAAKLAELVSGRHHRPLDALLLLHALEPVTRTEPIDMRTWARLLSFGTTRCTPDAASKAFTVLADLGLAEKEQVGRRTKVVLLHESGDSQSWTRPGSAGPEGGPGFFVLPHQFWTAGLAETLPLPGKAMLLIMLAEREPTFTMPVDKAKAWYGISERTAERGYGQLRDAGVTAERVQKIQDKKHPAGRRAVHHRALLGPYSLPSRTLLQSRTRKATRKKAAVSE